MNRLLNVLAVLILLPASVAIGQKMYSTSGGEIMLSSASGKQGGNELSTVARFAPVFNFQTQFHYDFGQKAGFFTGLNVRNLGFIYDDPATPNTRYKVRTYTVGIPLAIKLGKMNKSFIFGGYEFELPVNFKEKTFVNEDKINKFNTWFSERTPSIYQSVFFGIEGPQGVQLKFKYYLTNFFNKSYQAVDVNGNPYNPYKNLDVNVFYISLSAQILKGTKFYYGQSETPK